MILRILSILLFTLIVTKTTGQTSRPIEFYVTPSLSEVILKQKGTYIKEFLERETGLKIELKIPKSYDDMIENFGHQSMCFGVMNSHSYVVVSDKYKAVAKLRSVRSGHSVYQGMIVTHASSGIKTLNDLAGKTIAYTDEFSASGYLLPKKFLENANIKPGKEIFLGKHDEVVKQVYQRKVDAGAAFYATPGPNGELMDARGRIVGQFPDIEKKVIIILKTGTIPNDPVVFSKDFDAATTNKICVAMLKLSKDEKAKQALHDMYGAEAFVRASDADYDLLRQAMGLPE
jgi:phosphonate transport system substrate-binding protein